MTQWDQAFLASQRRRGSTAIHSLHLARAISAAPLLMNRKQLAMPALGAHDTESAEMAVAALLLLSLSSLLASGTCAVSRSLQDVSLAEVPHDLSFVACMKLLCGAQLSSLRRSKLPSPVPTLENLAVPAVVSAVQPMLRSGVPEKKQGWAGASRRRKEAKKGGRIRL